MKKNILLLSILCLVVLTASLVIASTANTIPRNTIKGNLTEVNLTIRTWQFTSIPIIGGNVTYITEVTAVSGRGSVGSFNVSEFLFYVPDNRTVDKASTFVLGNITQNFSAVTFTAGDNSYVNFSTGASGNLLNEFDSNLTFNITWIMSSPIASTKLSETRSGRAYTAKWNITSSATNLTIVNATLTLTPVYWYTRIGNPLLTYFNDTTKTYTLNVVNISVYTDLNQSTGGNMLLYGSGNEIIEIQYNGPEVSASSGSSSSGTTAGLTSTEIGLIKTKIWIIIALILIGLIIAGSVIYLLKKR